MDYSQKTEPGDASSLTKEEAARYSRHIMMPEVGREGQIRLKRARVLCIGAGGLGSPAALYLAAAGVGTIGVVDFDRVELSNLQRQILHATGDVGRPKTESARDRLRGVNPNVELELHPVQFSSENARELVASYDVVLDGSDNLATRYLSSDVCTWAQKPNVYGSVFRFEGQSTVFAPHLGGPCYRCLFPEPPDPQSIPSCAEAGVLGVVPGLIGVVQAIEAIKLILNVGEPLVGRLLHVDTLTMKFREFRLRRDPLCPVCGDSPTITEPIDYEGFCSGTRGASAVPAISVQDLQRRIRENGSIMIVDVRERFEFEIARIEGSTLIPLDELSGRLKELDPSKEIVAMCKSGIRSAHAVQFLRSAGYDKVFNLEGGIDAWATEIDPAMARY